MASKRGLESRIQVFFIVFTLVISACFSLLIILYSWVIEDNIFNRLVEREAAFIRNHHAETGQIPTPRPGFMQLYEGWDDMPAAIVQQHQRDPERVEFDHDGASIHAREIILGHRSVVLAAKVSGYEVSLDYFPVVSFWLVLGICLTCAMAAWIASLVAQSALDPLGRLTKEVAKLERIDEGFAKSYPDNEIGFLAQTIENSTLKLQAALQRETDLTRDLAHELRTPITVLTLVRDQVQANPEMNPKNLELFGNMVTELDQNITILTALAREENLVLASTDMLALLEECVINHYQGASEGDFDIHINIDKPFQAPCNPNLAMILINNLLTNARRYASEPRLAIGGSQHGLQFENAINEGEPIKGTGMGHGSSLIRRICERFGWRLRTEQEDGMYRVVIHF